MFAKEFDVVEFVRTQRNLRMLIKTLMDESERFLAPYQKVNAICLASDSEISESDDPAYKKIPKLISKPEEKKNHGVIIDQFFVSIINLLLIIIKFNILLFRGNIWEKFIQKRI